MYCVVCSECVRLQYNINKAHCFCFLGTTIFKALYSEQEELWWGVSDYGFTYNNTKSLQLCETVSKVRVHLCYFQVFFFQMETPLSREQKAVSRLPK